MKAATVIYIQIACVLIALMGVLGFLCPALISADDWFSVGLGFAILIFLPLLVAYAIRPAMKRLKRLQQEEGKLP